MNEVKYETKEACLQAIATIKAFGLEPAEWQLRQLKAFEDAEIAKQRIQNSETPIWDTLRTNYPYGEMPQEKIDCIEGTVAKLLEDGPNAEDPGLLLGKIQCGKTDTFEDIIGLSFDKGVDIAIVITKGTKALVGQTVKRMEKDYRFFKASDDLDQSATINIYDIVNIGKNGLKRATVENSKTVIVCKKITRNLEKLIQLFEVNSPFMKDKKVLIVDDEADFASRNYRNVALEAKMDGDGKPLAQTSEITMAKVSQLIDDFRKIPTYCRYLQVTATPYCLYLQPQGELNLNGNTVKPFKPRFTSIVPTHSAYMGGQQFFVESQNPDSMYSHLYHQIDQKCIDVLGHPDKRYINSTVSSGYIYGLTYTLAAYFIGTAIRRIQVRDTENKDYKTSAIIHVEIDKKNHAWQKMVVDRLIDAIRSAVVDEDQSDQRVWSAIDGAYDDYVISNEKGRQEGLISVEVPSREDVLDELRDIFSPKRHDYTVQLVNSDEDMESLLDGDEGELRRDTAANIFIGGNILDRGVTIKNMICFFYGRDPKNFQQDTVLQHARMYGARSKEDMAVMRMHTTDVIHKILVRMNELDDQLRQWFIEGKDELEPNAVFIGYDKNIQPCASQKIKASNALLVRPQKRMVPVGFWTGFKTAIGKTVAKIDEIITTCPGYKAMDREGFFEIDKETAVEILRLIETTYVYDEKFYNLDRKNDIKELLCALEYCTDKSKGKIFALHRTDRNMSRLRENGGYIDAPDDGRTDTKPSREKALDAPVLMLLRQNGSILKDEATGDNIGWNGAPFYWPVLMPQQNITPVMFALDQKAKGKTAVVSGDDFLGSINPADVLNLTFSGDLEKRFGIEGTDYELEDCPEEWRSLKKTTAGKYIVRDENGDYVLNPEVTFDEEHDHGLYTLNDGYFPFVLRPYKYMILRNKRDAKADVMLMELFEPECWDIDPVVNMDEDGYLLDYNSPNTKLTLVRDVRLDEEMNKTEYIDETIAQWIIKYKVKRVLKFKKCTIDWEAVFGLDEEYNT